jgi:hypothetical protein
MKALVIPCDITMPIEEINLNEESALEQLQGIVGGWIEALPLPGAITDYKYNATAYINEEGKFLDACTLNERATNFMMPGIGLFEGDYIAGNFIVCGFDSATGTHRDIPVYVEDRIRNV